MREKAERKSYQAITIAMMLIILIGLGVVFTFLTVTGQAEKQKGKATIALVNEDLTSPFNQEDYNFGKNFVNQVTGDNTYSWQVVSRAVADRAYRDKTVDAIIYIPQNFSQNILTLQEIQPTKAEVTYKVQARSVSLSEKDIQNKIQTVLARFNTSIVKMYYASVAGNVAESQAQMSGALSNQTQLSKVLPLTVQYVGNADQDFSGVVGVSSSLRATNSATIQSQNNFVDTAKTSLSKLGQSMGQALPNLSDYSQTQTVIDQTNLETANGVIKTGNGFLTHLYQTDSQLYNQLYGVVKPDGETMRAFSNPEDPENLGLYDKLVKQEGSLKEDPYVTLDLTLGFSSLKEYFYQRMITLINDYEHPSDPEQSEDPSTGATDPSGERIQSKGSEDISTDDAGDTVSKKEDIYTPGKINDETYSSICDEYADKIPELRDIKPQIKAMISLEKSFIEAKEGLYSKLAELDTLLSGKDNGLGQWYGKLVSEVNSQGASWQDTRSTPQLDPLSSSIWGGEGSSVNPTYYMNSSTGVTTAMSDLIRASMSETASLTGDSAAIQDNSSAFEALDKQTQAAQANTKQGLDTANQAVIMGDQALVNNTSYYNNFAKTLANTRTAGVDPNQIYDFFAQPIQEKDLTSETAPLVKGVDWRWGILFVIGLLLGALASLLITNIKR